jgi:hypothetical protein
MSALGFTCRYTVGLFRKAIAVTLKPTYHKGFSDPIPNQMRSHWAGQDEPGAEDDRGQRCELGS